MRKSLRRRLCVVDEHPMLKERVSGGLLFDFLGVGNELLKLSLAKRVE